MASVSGGERVEEVVEGVEGSVWMCKGVECEFLNDCLVIIVDIICGGLYFNLFTVFTLYEVGIIWGLGI